MKHLLPVILLALTLLGIAACTPLQTPPPLPTSTPLPPTLTPTATVVWFPPTPTPTAYPTPTAIITPTVNILPEYGNIIISDDFSDPSLWGQTKGSVGSVAVANNELTIAIKQPRGYLYSLRQQTNLSDFYAEITASPSICRDGDEYGLLFRVSPSFDFYRFSLTCNGQTRLDKYFKGVASSPQPPLYSSEVPPGAPSSSRLGIWASGRDLHLYINGVYQFSIRDASIPTGTLGVFARASGEGAVTVNFSNLVVYEGAR